MPNLFDDVARVLASPLPRRQAFRLIGWVLAGGALGALATRQASGQGKKDGCKPGHTVCGDKCCPPGKQCCTTGGADHCEPQGHTCCGPKSCPPGKDCVNGKCKAS